MSADPTDEVLKLDDEEHREALIAFCRLPAEAVAQITEAMGAMNLSFSDAAVHVGLVTEREAAEADAWVRATIARRNSKVIETALHRQTAARSVTVGHTVVGKPSSRLLSAYDMNNPHSEQIRALRTELLLLIETTRQASCLAILSPGSGEGRSQLAAELAISFSQLGRRALLVDADLRNPTQHLLFGAQVQWGLAQSLAYGEPPHLIGVQDLPFLTVLPSGPQVPNPLELISGGRFENLIRQSYQNYDFIVIDTPAVSQFADALTIAAMAGRVLLMSRAQTTSYKDMKAMLHRLGPTQTRILGAVISTF
jgi:protein-tyrosine kinase